MAIYEFYCPDCHTVFSFFARSAAPRRAPKCPRCGRPDLRKEISLFAAPSGAQEGAEAGADLPVDDARMERAMESLAGEAAGLNEDDPKQAARLMRKFSDMTGMRFAGGVEEAIDRMEAGEDPEAIESELGAGLDADPPFLLPTKGAEGGSRPARERGAPRRDPTLHDL